MARAGEKMVTIKLPRIPGGAKYEYVNVNNRNMYVPRGVTVDVPECFAEVLLYSEKAKEEAEARRDAMQQGADF